VPRRHNPVPELLAGSDLHSERRDGGSSVLDLTPARRLFRQLAESKLREAEEFLRPLLLLFRRRRLRPLLRGSFIHSPRNSRCWRFRACLDGSGRCGIALQV